MTTLIQDGPGDPERDRPEWLYPDYERLVELELRPGERLILLDTGASVSMISLDLARRLKLKLRMRDPIRVFGLGEVPTHISASARIKITLGPRIVYVMTVYVAGIGEGLEVLLGMNFMYAAGVRLSLREGPIQLPDEETVVMCGNATRARPGLDLPVFPEPSLCLGWTWRPLGNPDHLWGKSWVVAAKVVNIPPNMVGIDTGPAVARIVEFGCFPSAGRWVRPGRPKHNKWQKLIYESVPSIKMRRRAEEIERIRWESEPPCGQHPECKWPPKPMLRPRPGSTQVRIARLPGRPDAQDEGQSSRATQEVCTQTSHTSDAGTRTDVVQEPQTEEVQEVDSAGETGDLLERAEEEDGPECSDSHDQEDSDENDEIEDCPSQAMLRSPLYKLGQEYARCIRVNLEDLDLKRAVYIQEGSELMSQLCDEVATIPELNDLSPECDITQADVGEPGRTTPDEDRKLRTVLEYHRTLFLGDGNAVPAPARGVVCDLDECDAKPVAQRPRSVAPHLMLKVYELLKKLFETKLIKNSESPWASSIMIVLKKNGVDIRMCIDYRVVNGFIKLSNYPLPLIDDLLIGVETAMCQTSRLPCGS
ncbi:unnamed protein product [Phytophthora fragariaefolia]|uniref:Unnamed protein product n=1 Tax=Phytophthora fragariaefolia TaxID=1490495 RepID=A0A9W7CZ10_9STRA|nr:unnamed protein product [Phytophthora fragariaefolia]